MFGYATDEWDTEYLHPYSHWLANKISEEMGRQRHGGELPWLRPDCKCQVILEYIKEKNGRLTPIRVYNILISTQHSPDISLDKVKSELEEKVIRKVIPANMLADT